MRAMRATTRSMSAASTITGRSHGSGFDRSALRAPGPGSTRRFRAASTAPGLVDEVDGAVGQPVVAQMARRQLGRGLERRVGVRDAVMLLVPAAQARRGSCTVSSIDGSSIAIFCSRRASARSFSMCLNSSNVVEPMTRRSPAVRIGLIIVARSIVPPVTAPAPTVEWISSMKRIGFGRARERLDDRLEALLEVAAEARAGEQRAGVEREDFGVLQRALARRRPAAAWPGLRPSPSCRRRRRRRTPDCSCGAGRALRSCAAARRRGR